MAAAVLDETALCATTNVPFTFPAAIVTVCGTDAAELFELVTDTTIPPIGADPLRLIVAVTDVEALPTTEAGEIVSAVTVGGRTVSVAC